MVKEILSYFLAFSWVGLARADFQFIDFWEASDEYAAEIFSTLNVGSKKFASSFQNRYNRAKLAAKFYQDSGPCDSGFTNPSYEPVEMKIFDPRAAMSTNLRNFADMLDSWINSYACLASRDRVAGKQIRVPQRSVKDIRKMSKRDEFQEEEFAYHISPTTMDYDEALAYCYLRGSWLAEPAGDKNRFGAMKSALDNQWYWFHGDDSCTAVSGTGEVVDENCNSQFPAVCETGQFTDKCYPAEYKWCTAWGDPHFTTFDGEFHHLQPRCEYVMAKVDTDEYPNVPKFNIIGDFAPVEPGSSLTYTQGFTFEFPGQDQSPDEIPRYVISVERDDRRTSGIRRSILEDRLTGDSYDSSFGNNDFDLYISDTVVVIITWFEVYVKYTASAAWNGRNYKLQIRVPDCYAHNINGLCGNYDGEKYVEFTSGTSGSLTRDLDNWRTTQENLYAWADQFQVPDELCHRIFDLNCAVDINHAITACQALDPDNSESIFEPCSGDKGDAFFSCVTEKCDRSDECLAFESFAKECINALEPEEREPICDWANELGCSTACGANAVFEGCADTCAATRTCRNRHQSDFERCGANTEIDSMCVCEPGFILDGEDCIPEENCGCTENGYYYALGSVFQKPNRWYPEENCECTTSGIVCTPTPCDQMQKGHCKIHSDPWITTFDKTYYAFHGSCRYNLVKADDTEDRPGFSIDISNRGSSRWTSRSGSHSGTVVDQIWLEAHSSDYVFGNQKRYFFHFNNRDNSADYMQTELDITLVDRLTERTYFNTDFSNDDISLEITLSDYAHTAGFNLQVHSNGLQIKYKYYYWWMDVYVPSCYKESVSGLCGDWDGNSDFSLSRDYQNDPDEFGERFMTARISDECTHGRFFEPCEDLEPAEFTAAIERCDSLEDGTDQAEVFRTCDFVSDKQGYFDRCLWNSCLDLACGSIQNFAEECLLRKTEGTADFNEICNWPQVTSCTEECSGGQVFKGCTNSCKEARTCDDVVNGVSDADRCGSERSIYPMCGCPDGQVMHNGECINEEACPRDCVSTGTSYCTAYGDPHYRMFDGDTHHFQGACKYRLVKSSGDDEFRNMPAFNIDVDQRRCGADSNAVSCVQGMTFEFPGKNQFRSETPRYFFTVDRFSYIFEDRHTGQSYENGFVNDDVTFEKRGSTAYVRTWFEAETSYTPYSRWATLRVTLPDCYMNHVDGLCGNWNNQTFDEFNESAGIWKSEGQWRVHQEELVEWANDFAEPDPRCREIHDFECDDIDEVTDLCAELDKNIPGGVFHECTAPRDAAYMSCMIDTCISRDARCSTLQNYARECLNTIPFHLRPNICSWASDTGCELECGDNSSFLGCANTCDAQRTCRNRHLSSEERCGSSVDNIESMCACDPGYILDDGGCVLEENCGCTWDYNNQYYPQGTTFSNNDETCECTTSGVVCTPIPCDRMQRGHCEVMSDPWITTFDNTYYAFHGSCRYNLVKADDTEDRAGFSIDISNRGSSRWTDRSGSHSGTVVDQIWLEAHSSDYVFGNQKRYSFHFNNRDNSANYMQTALDITLVDRLTGQTYFNTDFSNDDISLKITVSNNAHTAGFNLQVHSNGLEINYKYYYWWMDVYISRCYKDSVSGLCGDWDGNSDILMSRDYENDPDEFGERFMTARISDECTHGRFFEPCEDLEPAEFTAAIERCDSLEDGTDQADVFRTCDFVSDKQGYYDRCLWNSCLDLACGSIQNFAEECLLRKTEGTADFNEICNWPQVTSCTEECSGGQVFKGCTNSCKEERTCDDVVNGISDVDRCGSERSIYPMCGCPDGQVMHNGECINEEACPRDCVSTGTSYCTAYGDPHYRMFDGDTHHFQGACKYRLVKSSGDDEFRNMPAFNIDVDQRRCGDDSNAVSCVQGMTFEFPGRNQLRSETPRYFFTVDGSSFLFEDRQTGQSYENGFVNDDVTFEKRGSTAYVRTWFEAETSYTPYSRWATLRVTLPDCYMNHVDGLCGNWNNQSFDEFNESAGIWKSEGQWRVHQEELVEWANDFAEPDPRCREIHDFECDDIDEVTDLCAELDKNIPGGVFHECTAPRDAAYMSCMIDTCISRDARCNTLQNYARECLNTIPSHLRPNICSWASDTGCERECGDNSSFLGCANTCDAQRTCRNRHLSSEERCGSSVDNIESMCACNPGYILDDGGCVLEENCGCTWDYNNQYYPQGRTFSNNDETCECTTSGVVCTPIPCDRMQKGHCEVMSDPWITTFDDTYYAFHGSCRYNLVKADDTEDRPGFSIDISNRGSSRWTDRSGSHSGTVVDQIWLEAHSSDYVFGNQKRYSFHFNNRDNSANYMQTALDITLVDRLTGQTYFNTDFSNDDISLKITVSNNAHTAGFNLQVHSNGLEINYKYYYWWMDVYISSCYKDSVSGLCGDWDGNSDILMSRDYQNDPDEFGERFMTARISDECTHGRFFEPCEDLEPAEFTAAIERCDSLEDGTDQAEVFRTCDFVSDKQGYYDRCLWNSCLDLACGSIQNFAEECLLRKTEGTADFNEICNWPQVTSCTEECSGGQIFKGCTNSCKEERTCDDVVNGISDADRCGSERSIYPMCGCPDGQVMHNGECINEESCPRDCVSTGTGSCKASGDPHYTMFDGDTHHFQGSCKYSFVKSSGDEDFRNMPAFNIDVDQRRCGEDSRAVSCIYGMTFEFPGENQHRSETPRYFLTIDGFSFVFEDRQTGESYENGFSNDDVTFEKIGRSAKVRTWFEAETLYTPYHQSYWGIYATLEVTLPNCYMNHVDGLCGNWNGEQFDQFHRIGGDWLGASWRAHQEELVEWANDFAEPDPRCREVHDFECDDIEEVTDLCHELDKNIPGGVFHECTAPKDAAYLSCLIDTCISRDARCNTLQNYARECLNTIPSHLRPNICSWASDTGCELECGDNSSFLGCANTCDAQRTCRNRHLSSEERCGSSVGNIESMCACDPGYILDDGGCVLEENCGCTWDFNNQYYPQGRTFSNNDETCECTADGIVCAPIPCENRPTAYCRSHNDPFIYTFDEYEYFFHGICRYNLASAPDTVELPGFNVDSKNRKTFYGASSGTVTDQLWFDFHGADYVFGDSKRYSLTIKNLDTSIYWTNAHFEITLTDHRTGENIIDRISSSTRNSFTSSDYEITVKQTRWNSNIFYDTVEIRIANGVSVEFSTKSFSAYVRVNSCFKNIMTGLCGNYNDNNSDERLLSTEYDDDSNAVGERFRTDSDETCSHGELLKPCEDLLEESDQAAVDAAEDRCDIVNPRPNDYLNRGFFNGCEFLGSRMPTYEACLFHSCLDPEMHCGIIEDYASQCLARKVAGTADYQRICEWASVTGCAQECPALESGLGESPIRAEDPYKISLEVFCTGERADAMTGMASYLRQDGSQKNGYYFGVGGVNNKLQIFVWMENPDFEKETGWELLTDFGDDWWELTRNPTYLFLCEADSWNSIVLTQEYEQSQKKWVKTLNINGVDRYRITTDLPNQGTLTGYSTILGREERSDLMRNLKIERLSKKEITAHVFKGCTNACFEQQTCEDVARGISREQRCAATANRVEGMCGCPDGFLFEDGVCVAESSCGCINNDGNYVELGTVEGGCTCTSTGYECEPEPCPCEEFDSCIDFICEDAQSFFVPEDGIIGEFTATRNFELSYEFNCGAMEANSTYVGPHIYATGEFPRSFNEGDDPTKPTEEKRKKKRKARFAGSPQYWYIGWTDAIEEDSLISSTVFDGGKTYHGFAFFFDLGYCDEENFNTMKYTQNFDEEDGTYTQNFYFNGELKETKVYSENEFTPYEGDLTVSLLPRGYDYFQRWPGTIKNFYIRETNPNRIVLVNNEPIAPAEDTMIATLTSSAYYTAEMEIFCATDSLPLDGGLFGYKSILAVTSGTDYGELGSRVFTVWRNSGNNLLWFANPIGKSRDHIATPACDAGQYNHWKLVVRADDTDASITVAELFKDGVLIATKTGPKSDTIGDGEELQVWAGNGWPDFPRSGYGIGSTYLIKNVIFNRQ
ncbi:Oidioi.mRNA.OKI2018_I69.PAR.g8984.t1.cds [Oikopleura dioica]|uniref:Oidioi.mRNA.OKI2018_I69.PAR.g8984.t1.cds n=1 Tax=Oikopleura dioica TaxID=34765 RepID=A0ABN7RM55_OIKDI|nr:Oidioi.mRNA.OKI2018_I69.PAR.g8984.t1.cds [Oikopleura dioica]